MKQYLPIMLVSSLFAMQVSAQSLREEIVLKGMNFKIYDQDFKSAESDETKYQVVGNQGDKIEHIARVFDKKKNKETSLGIYRKNDSELHFIEFDQTKTPQTLSHFVYSPNNKGALMLIKKEIDLKDFPKDLPPKFKNNQPIYPEFPGGNSELNKWTETNLVPILKKSKAKKDFVLTLEIDENGDATLQNSSILSLPSEAEKALVSKIKEMPKWTTDVQGYKVSGIVLIPVSL